jgi:hypothetical protein
MVEVPGAWIAPGSPPDSGINRNPGLNSARNPAGAGAIPLGPGSIPVGRTGTRPIPLRPLTVLELIDGAVGSVRSLPRRLLFQAFGLVAGVGAVGVGLQWAFDAAISDSVHANPAVTYDGYGDPMANPGGYTGSAGFSTFVVDALIPIVLSGFATTILAGLFAPSIKRYVDGEVLDPRRAPQDQRGHLAVLLRIGFIALLPRALLVALLALTAALSAEHPGSGYAGLDTLFLVAGVPLCSWATAQFAVAAPVAALESRNASRALARSGHLASHGRWRTWWASGLTLFIGMCATAILISLGYAIDGGHRLGAVNLATGGGTAYRNLVGYAAVLVLPLMLTVPFRATTATMIYVDRRFRREGLDIRIGWARVAGNEAARRGTDVKAR